MRYFPPTLKDVIALVAELAGRGIISEPSWSVLHVEVPLCKVKAVRRELFELVPIGIQVDVVALSFKDHICLHQVDYYPMGCEPKRKI